MNLCLWCLYPRPGPDFMALLTVSKESALTEAGNSTLTSSVFHGLAGNFCLCACELHVTRHSFLTQLAQKFGACKISRECEIGPYPFTFQPRFYTGGLNCIFMRPFISLRNAVRVCSTIGCNITAFQWSDCASETWPYKIPAIKVCKCLGEKFPWVSKHEYHWQNK